MASGNHEKSIASTLLFGLIGAGLVFCGRRRSGILAAIATTAGYSLITRAVSTTVFRALSPASD